MLDDETVADPLEVRLPDASVLPVGTNTRSTSASSVQTTKLPVCRPDIVPCCDDEVTLANALVGRPDEMEKASRSHSPVAWYAWGPRLRVPGGSVTASRLVASGWITVLSWSRVPPVAWIAASATVLVSSRVLVLVIVFPFDTVNWNQITVDCNELCWQVDSRWRAPMAYDNRQRQEAARTTRARIIERDGGVPRSRVRRHDDPTVR